MSGRFPELTSCLPLKCSEFKRIFLLSYFPLSSYYFPKLPGKDLNEVEHIGIKVEKVVNKLERIDKKCQVYCAKTSTIAYT